MVDEDKKLQAWKPASLTPEQIEEGRLAVEGPDTIDIAFTKEKITPHYLVKKLKKELNAKKTEFGKFGGQITSSKKVIDWTTRQNARIDAQKLLNLYPAEKLKGDIDLTISVINYGKKDKDGSNDSG
ncbi:MAG: hypothetical protein ABIA66_00180 [Candidatus Omnitrophota bacterium]